MPKCVEKPPLLAGGFIIPFGGHTHLFGDHERRQADRVMDVTLYTRRDCEVSRRIRELLRDKGVEFDELEGEQVVAVVDGVAIPGTRRAQIEQAIGWIGC